MEFFHKLEDVNINFQDTIIGFRAAYTGFMWYSTFNGLTVVDTDYIHNDTKGEDSNLFVSVMQAIPSVVFMGNRFSNVSISSYRSIATARQPLNRGRLVGG